MRCCKQGSQQFYEGGNEQGLYLSLSTDGLQRWTKPELVTQPIGKTPYWAPVLHVEVNPFKLSDCVCNTMLALIEFLSSSDSPQGQTLLQIARKGALCQGKLRPRGSSLEVEFQAI